MLDDQIFCPSCGENTEHTMIKTGQENLVRCAICEMVHPAQRGRERLVTLKVIVNKGELSEPHMIKVPANENLYVGDELLVDDAAKDVVMTKITSLETDRRTNSALAESVKTIWARAIDEVSLKASVYRDGLTHSLKTVTPGDEVFQVGEVRQIKRFKFEIVKIKLRNEGFAEIAAAKDIVRIWGREIES